ncbi:MAG TPA: hypothetical protein VGH19_22925 [Verrucomicrobiae bacterium]
MPNPINLELVIGGSKEGTEYRFIGDEASLRQLAQDILNRLDGKEPGPWPGTASMISCEPVAHESGLIFKSKGNAFLSFQKSSSTDKDQQISDLEQQLAQARRHTEKAQLERFSWKELTAAFEALASAQRALAAAKGMPYAVPYDIGFKPEAAVPDPIIFQSEDAIMLAFCAVKEMPDGMRADAGFGIIDFKGCMATKFGYPNDEALPGHPLYEWGLSAYDVFEVINSKWVKEMAEQNKVVFPEHTMSPRRHFIFTFHDTTFECVTRELHASLSTKSYPEISEELRRRVMGG